jgi:hypothetical protein
VAPGGAGRADRVRNDSAVADAWRLRAPASAGLPCLGEATSQCSRPRGMIGVKPVRGAAHIERDGTPPRRLAGGVVIAGSTTATVSSTPPIGVFSSAAMAFLRDEEKASSSNADRS